MNFHRHVLLAAAVTVAGSATGFGQEKPGVGANRMLGVAKLMAFAAVGDANRAKAFYADTLGLRLIADEAFALVFDANGTQLRLQKVQKMQPLPFTVLGWEVPNIRESILALRERGVTFERIGFMKQDDLGVWTADDGTKVAWFKDPDGNVLSLTQFVKQLGPQR